MADSSGEHVRYSFHGDAQVEIRTTSQRDRIREILVELSREVQKLSPDNKHSLVSADIKIKTTKDTDVEHVYHVDIGSVEALNSISRKRKISSAEEHGDSGFAYDGVETNGYQSESPEKRMRTASVDQPEWRKPQRKQSFGQSSSPKPGTNPEHKALMKFLQEWRQQWTQQGGWMFDHLSGMKEDERRKKVWLQQQFETHATGMTAMMNANQDKTMQSLQHLTELSHWLDSNRKTAHETAQAREEKWRMSSATFHDSTRKDREKAEEKALEELKGQRMLLEKQQKILIQLMESQGLDLDTFDE